MIGIPPLDAGVVHCSKAEDAAAVADVAVGFPGIVAKITGLDAVEAAESPCAFVATTWNVYELPSVKALIVVTIGLLSVEIVPLAIVVVILIIFVLRYVVVTPFVVERIL